MELEEMIEDFFERTCINEFIFKEGDLTKIMQMKKKTPIGTWNIESIELGYFINIDDQVVVTILNRDDDELYEKVAQLLTERARKPIT